MSYTVIQGKGISKTDKELVQAILGGEMKNAWEKGDGVDTRAERQTWTPRDHNYPENYERIFGHP